MIIYSKSIGHTQSSSCYAAKSEGIRFLAQSADQVIVSTRKLAQLFHRLNNQTTVVGNALDEWLWFSPLAIPGRRVPADVILAGYMGTRTHRAGLGDDSGAVPARS